MALVVTSAAGNIGLNDTFIKFTAHTTPTTSGIGPKEFALIDKEYVQVTDATLSPTLQVVRGALGTLACAHKILAPIVYGLSSDFTGTASTDARAASPSISIAVNDTAVTLPVVDSTVYLTKATALGITILGPNSDQTNTITFISLTAAAHVITYTAGFYQNTTSSDLATFPATSGACFTIVAKNGVWNALSSMTSAGVTIG